LDISTPTTTTITTAAAEGGRDDYQFRNQRNLFTKIFKRRCQSPSTGCRNSTIPSSTHRTKRRPALPSPSLHSIDFLLGEQEEEGDGERKGEGDGSRRRRAMASARAMREREQDGGSGRRCETGGPPLTWVNQVKWLTQVG
jgi:hypothetical protein